MQHRQQSQRTTQLFLLLSPAVLLLVLLVCLTGCSRKKSIDATTITPDAQQLIDKVTAAYKNIKTLQVQTEWTMQTQGGPPNQREQRDQAVLAFDREKQLLRADLLLQDGSEKAAPTLLFKDGKVNLMMLQTSGIHAEIPYAGPLAYEPLVDKASFLNSLAVKQILMFLLDDKPLDLTSGKFAKVEVVMNPEKKSPGIRVETDDGALVIWVDPKSDLMTMMTVVQPGPKSTEVIQVLMVDNRIVNGPLKSEAFNVDFSKSVVVSSLRELVTAIAAIPATQPATSTKPAATQQVK